MVAHNYRSLYEDCMSSEFMPSERLAEVARQCQRIAGVEVGVQYSYHLECSTLVISPLPFSSICLASACCVSCSLLTRSSPPQPRCVRRMRWSRAILPSSRAYSCTSSWRRRRVVGPWAYLPPTAHASVARGRQHMKDAAPPCWHDEAGARTPPLAYLLTPCLHSASAGSCCCRWLRCLYGASVGLVPCLYGASVGQ